VAPSEYVEAYYTAKRNGNDGGNVSELMTGLIAGASLTLAILAIGGYMTRALIWTKERWNRELREQLAALTEGQSEVANCVRELRIAGDARWGEHSKLHKERRELGREHDAELSHAVQLLEIEQLRLKLEMERYHP
jgi:hypothetical protein